MSKGRPAGRAGRYGTMVSLLVVAAAVGVQGDQTQGPVTRFRSNVSLIEVDATVVDSRGEFVRGLTADDFEIFEDGQPRPVAAFSLVDLPVARLAAPAEAAQPPAAPESVPPAPDVVTNDEPLDGRIFVLVLDDLHINARRTLRVKNLARQFIDRYVGPRDLVAVLTTGPTPGTTAEFGSSPAAVQAAIDRFVGAGLPSATLARAERFADLLLLAQAMEAALGPGETPPMDSSSVTDPLQSARTLNARASFRVLRQTADVLGRLRGRRKAIIYVGEGITIEVARSRTTFETPALFLDDQSGELLSEMNDFVTAAARADVTVYTVDPRGLATAEEAIEAVPSPEPFDVNALTDEVSEALSRVRKFADDTGGVSVVNTNNLEAGLERIARENSLYYALAFQPAGSRNDGRFRRIEVKVRRPGLTVRARRGYVDALSVGPARRSGPVCSALDEAMRMPLPVPGLRMRVAAAPFRGPGGSPFVLVSVWLDGQDVQLGEASARTRGALDFRFLVTNPDTGAVVRTSSKSATFALKPGMEQAVKDRGLQYFETLELPPGQYRLRVGAAAEGDALAGAVATLIEVPDFTKAPVALSGLLLGSAVAEAVPSMGATDRFSVWLPSAPTTERRFARNDDLTVFCEIYPGTHDVLQVVTHVIDGAGDDALVSSAGVRTGEAPGRAHPFVAQIPLSELDPGSYRVRMDVSTGSGEPLASREVAFAVYAPGER